MIKCDNIREELIYRVPLILRSLHRYKELNYPENLSEIIEFALDDIKRLPIDKLSQPKCDTVTVFTDNGSVSIPDQFILSHEYYIQFKSVISSKFPNRKLRKTIRILFYGRLLENK